MVEEETKTLNKAAGSKTIIWAKKGEKVKIINISGNAVTCEKENGIRFPCNIKDLE